MHSISHLNCAAIPHRSRRDLPAEQSVRYRADVRAFGPLRASLGVMLCGMLLLLVSAIPSIGQGTGGNPVTTPIVVVRADDIRGTWRTPYIGLGNVSGLTYGKQKNIPMTWAIITSLAASPSTNLTWAELKDYLDNANGEAASHSVTHSEMSSDAAYVSEVVDSKAAIEANLPGYSYTRFFSPALGRITPI